MEEATGRGNSNYMTLNPFIALIGAVLITVYIQLPALLVSIALKFSKFHRHLPPECSDCRSQLAA